MTPPFAAVVDPVFQYVLDLRQRIDQGEHPSALQEHERVLESFARAETKVFEPVTADDWKLAKYALAAWTDEVLHSSAWDEAERMWWNNHAVEFELFNTHDRYEEFYVRAKAASALPRRDAFEVFYLCVVLGFRGLYEDPSSAATHDLPASIDAWASQAVARIRLNRAPNINQKPERQMGAPPLENQPLLVVSSLVSAVLAAAFVAALVKVLDQWLHS